MNNRNLSTDDIPLSWKQVVVHENKLFMFQKSKGISYCWHYPPRKYSQNLVYINTNRRFLHGSCMIHTWCLGWFAAEIFIVLFRNILKCVYFLFYLFRRVLVIISSVSCHSLKKQGKFSYMVNSKLKAEYMYLIYFMLMLLSVRTIRKIESMPNCSIHNM